MDKTKLLLNQLYAKLENEATTDKFNEKPRFRNKKFNLDTIEQALIISKKDKK